MTNEQSDFGTSESSTRILPSSSSWNCFGATQSALFRILFGTVLLLNLWIRVKDGQIDLFYTEEGLLPLYLLDTTRGWSFLYSFNTPLLARVGFTLIALCYLCYTFGVCLRATKWLVVLCLLSLYHRAPTVDDGSDWTMRLWAIWTAFLPLGRKWSIDARFKEKYPFLAEPRNTLAAILLATNLAFSYLFNCLQKEGGAWQSGEAGRYILSDPAGVSHLGVWLRNGAICDFLPLFTKGSLIVEVILFFAIFLSFRYRIAGYLTTFGIVLLHGFLGLVLSIGTFSLVYISLAVLFLPLTTEGERLVEKRDTTRSPWYTLPTYIHPTYIIGVVASLAFAWYSLISFIHSNPLVPPSVKSTPLPGSSLILESARQFFMIPQEWFMFRNTSAEGITVSVSLMKEGEKPWDPARNAYANYGEVAREGTRLGKYWTTYLTRLRFQDSSRFREYFAKFYLAKGYDRVEVVEVKAFAAAGCRLEAPPPSVLPLFSLNTLNSYPIRASNLQSPRGELPVLVEQNMDVYGREWKNSIQTFGVFGELGQTVTFSFSSSRECRAEVFLDRAVAQDYADLSVSINQVLPPVHLGGSTPLGVLRERTSLGVHSILKGENSLSIAFHEGIKEGRTRFGVVGVEWRCI